MGTTQRNRRQFLKSGAALAGLTVTGVRPALGQSAMAIPAWSTASEELPTLICPGSR